MTVKKGHEEDAESLHHLAAHYGIVNNVLFSKSSQTMFQVDKDQPSASTQAKVKAVSDAVTIYGCDHS